MSFYFIKGKGWRYDFTLKGIRYTEAWFRTKAQAKRAEEKRKEEIDKPKTRTGISFLDLVNRRLDFIKSHNSEKHYMDMVYLARKWVREWGGLECDNIKMDMIEAFLFKVAKTSRCTANKNLKFLRAFFNYGIKREWIRHNPARDISFFSVVKKKKYVPSKQDVYKVILAASPDTQDYLWAIKETMGRMGEINRMTWDDIDFEKRCVTLWTRKKRDGHLISRDVPMTNKLYDVFLYRFKKRDKSKPWVFWHRYFDRKSGNWTEGPYKDRKRIMKTLCQKVGVRYFRYHALRHFGASVLDDEKVKIGSIQLILGHETRRTTEGYLHSISESEREAMAIYEKACESHMDSHKEKNKGLSLIT